MIKYLDDLLVFGGVASLGAGVFLEFGLPVCLMVVGGFSFVIGSKIAFAHGHPVKRN